MANKQTEQDRSLDGDRKAVSRTAVIWWLCSLSYMCLIFVLSSQSDLGIRDIPRNFDKVLHMLAYVPLAVFLYNALSGSGLRKFVFVGAFVIASVYGMTDELHQSFVAGRDAELLDVVADSTGAFIGALGAHRGRKLKQGVTAEFL